jgi:hypothetical protein
MNPATTTEELSASGFMAAASAISSQQAPSSDAEMVCAPNGENDLSSLLLQYRQIQYRIEIAQRTIRNLAAIFGNGS